MRSILLSMLLVVLTACVTPTLPPMVSPSCTRIQGAPLASQIGHKVDPEEFSTWITSNYEIAADKIAIGKWMDGYSFRWKANTVQYSAEVDANIVTGGIVYFTNSLYTPQIKGVVECLGEPGFYNASYDYVTPLGIKSLNIVILYPEKGVMWSGYKYLEESTDPITVLNDQFVMYSFFLEIPGSKAEVLNQVYSTSTMREEIAARFKPWPGSVKGMTIDDLTSE